MEDARIIELFFSRSEQALSETGNKYGKLCMKIADSILPSKEDSEECVSSSYLKLWNAIPPKRPESLCGYLCSIVRNTALSAVRKKTPGTVSELDEAIPYGKTVEEEYDAKRLSGLMNDFLRGCKRRTREIFISRYYFNLSVRDISVSFGMSENAVLSQLMRTRKKLKEFLTERGADV